MGRLRDSPSVGIFCGTGFAHYGHFSGETYDSRFFPPIVADNTRGKETPRDSEFFPLPQKKWSIQADNGVRIKIQLESPIMALTPSPHQGIVFVP